MEQNLTVVFKDFVERNGVYVDVKNAQWYDTEKITDFGADETGLKIAFDDGGMIFYPMHRLLEVVLDADPTRSTP